MRSGGGRGRGSDRRHPLEIAFALLLLALPPGPLRSEDGAAMRATLRDQVADAGSLWNRWRVTVRALRRLPGVIVVEWIDWIGLSGRGPAVHHGGDGMMRRMLKALGFAARSLRKAPTFAVATVALIALGVGTVTTVFAVVDHVLLRPLPYAAADRLVYLTNGSHNGATLRRLDGVEAFETWTATSSQYVNLTRPDGEPLRLRRAETTPEYFTMFGARPHLGRLLVDADERETSVAVVSFPFWRDVLGSDRDVVGTTMRIDGEPVEIVGVLAEDFVPPQAMVGASVDFYRSIDWTRPSLDDPGYHTHTVVARLAPGVALAQADEQMDRVAAEVAASAPETYEGLPDWPLQPLQLNTVEDVRGGLLLLLGAVGLLLLVACVNVAHLFMARGLARSHEMSVRRALGARTLNLLGQLSAESLVVGVVGGAGGLVVAQTALGLFRRWTTELPRGADVALDVRVFAVCLALATLTALVFGLLPAFRAMGRDVQEGLRPGTRQAGVGRGVRGLRSGLVIFEVAVSLVLVASAGLLVRSFLSVTSVDPGVVAEGVWVVPLNAPGIDTPEEYRLRMESIRAALASIPGVASATYGIEAPFEFVGGDRCCWNNRLSPPDDPLAEPLRINLHPAAEGYFETYRTEIVAGDAWTRAAAAATPTPVVLSEPLAVRLFGSADAAIGRELPDLVSGASVVGVAEYTRHYGLDQEHDFAAYLPIEALPFSIPRATFALRAMDAPGGLAGSIREAVWSQEGSLPVPTVSPLDEWMERSSATRRFGSLLLGAFAAVALLLAAAGLYGTLLYAVGQRRRELGIRLALGAERGRIQREVVRAGVVQAALGVIVGVVAAAFAGRLLESWLFGIGATDPLSLGWAAAVLFGTAVGASWIPAYQAGHTDPLDSLRAE